jgi:hypothetical protein
VPSEPTDRHGHADPTEAFFRQSPREILAALDRPVSDVVPDHKAEAFAHAVDDVRRGKTALFVVVSKKTPGSPRAVRRARVKEWKALKLYEGAQREHKAVWATWQRGLSYQGRRTTKERKEAARLAASGKLREELEKVFPSMRKDRLVRLVQAVIRRDTSDRRDVLLAHVGWQLGGVSASTIRDAVGRARSRRTRWRRFVRWIARHHRQRRGEMVELVDLLEEYRDAGHGQPPADFYETCGPLLLDWVRLSRLRPPRRHVGSSHPGLPQVSAPIPSKPQRGTGRRLIFPRPD